MPRGTASPELTLATVRSAALAHSLWCPVPRLTQLINLLEFFYRVANFFRIVLAQAIRENHIPVNSSVGHVLK
jgi:hypothetical protein